MTAKFDGDTDSDSLKTALVQAIHNASAKNQLDVDANVDTKSTAVLEKTKGIIFFVPIFSFLLVLSSFSEAAFYFCQQFYVLSNSLGSSRFVRYVFAFWAGKIRCFERVSGQKNDGLTSPISVEGP